MTTHMRRSDRPRGGAARDMLGQALALLAERRDAVAAKRVVAGFDGCHDSIMRVYRSAGDDAGDYFPDMKSFGEHIIQKHDMSCSVELEERESRIGGNAPIFAHAMGSLGVGTDLFGTLGFPDIHPVFRQISGNTVLHSYAPNNIAMALEFDDGKVILAPRHRVADAWARLQASARGRSFAECVAGADLLMLNNWSELDYSQSLWERICDELILPFPADFGRFVMADLSDCSRRDAAQIGAVCDLLRKFAERRHVVLGLNENEAGVLHRSLLGKRFDGPTEELADAIHSRCGADEVVVHTNYEAVAKCGGERVHAPTLRVDNPKTVTGGGDRFNAGYALGLLLGAPLGVRAVLGNAVSSQYIMTGVTADYDGAMGHLRFWMEEA